MKIAGVALAFLVIANANAADRVETRVEQTARQILSEQAAHAGLAGPVVEAIVVKTNSPAPSCRQAVSVQAVDTRYPGRMRFAAVCPDAGGARQEYVARATLSAEVVVAVNAIRSNRVIRDADVMLQRRELGTMSDATSDVDAVVGQSSRRSLRAGDIMQKQALVSPILVKRGAAVRIVARSGPVDVSAAGETLEAGRRDEVVRVRNVSTGKVIRARVKDSDMVEPADMPMSSQSLD